MTKDTAITVQAPDHESALAQGAALLGMLPEEVDVTPAGEDHFLVTVRDRPGTFEIRLQPDQMAVFLAVTPPSGSGSPVQAEEVLQALAGGHIVFGIDAEEIGRVVARVAASGAAENGVCIARGEEPLPGEDGRVEPRPGPGGLDGEPPWTWLVKPGQELAVRIPPVAGTPGRKVLGGEIPVRPVVDQPFSAGPHVQLALDGLSYVATIYGRAVFSPEGVAVANLVEVAADKMSAWLAIHPLMADGSHLETEDVLATLAAAGVVHGIREEAIRTALHLETPAGRVQVAHGTPARPGTAGAIEFGFRLAGKNPLAVARPPLLAKYISKNLVVAGQVLARKTPATPAVNGCTVTGEIVAGPPSPPDLAISAGDHVTVLENGHIYAVAEELVAGYADYAGGVLAVEEPLRLSADAMQALLTIHPPDENGTGLDEELVGKLLQRQGIVYGISTTAIRKGLAFAAENNRPLYDVVVARGVMPIRGRDAIIDIQVDIQSRAGWISEETDRIDFRERSFIQNVRKGQVLARKISAEPGVDGRDILGRVLPAEAGTDRQLAPHANVVLSEDGLALISDLDGMVSLVNGQIGVFEVYEVAGDVDYATGNLEMAGALNIKGWIKTGFTVRATGDILIGGGAEGTVISAAGNIVIRGGAVSLERGRIQAKGDVTVRFLERARVKAGGNVFVHDQIMRSVVFADGTLAAVSGKGRIRGGTVSAVQGIVANEVGSEAGVKTVLIAGTNITLRRLIVELGKQINGHRRELAKMDTVLARFLGRGRGASLPKETARKLALVGKRRRALAMDEARLARSREELSGELAAIDLKSIKIVIKKRTYAGTTVIIGGRIHKVTEDMGRPVTFFLNEEGRIATRCN